MTGFRPFGSYAPAHARLRCALLGIVLAVLGGCAMKDGPGTLLVDPGHYDAYHCNDLAARWKVLVAREKELRDLMNKASEAPGGGVIGSLAYRGDYDSVVSEERLLQRTAAEKNCGNMAQFQSDQSIR